MTPDIFIKRTLAARSVTHLGHIQSLWSGYGNLSRYRVGGVEGIDKVVLKSIRFDQQSHHPRGWHSDHAHQRKLDSYQVERNWYQHWNKRCTSTARTAKCFGFYEDSECLHLLLEDLDSVGFDRRCDELSVEQSLVCLEWLACFHSEFLCAEPAADWPAGLWSRGTYWHLNTRPDEWRAMVDGPLKQHAQEIDRCLEQARFQTLVHGDAKVANFCFSEDMSQVAAVDFQYVGKGIGSQDVAYFLGSCLDERTLDLHIEYLLEYYFSELNRCLIAQGESPDLSDAVCSEWYELFAVAWADFHRFLLGWSPQHHKNTAFSQKMTDRGLRALPQLSL
ncbi:DUF1679 domain-containing protein [Maribrevibacterium harenarium]|uniref:DUF1679 domain-containing protein n=1 Tax=Maribrevibacterium harenarium TaxID=2589817 RepID=A0A501X1S9_9GAMM|nr:phosphotransferase [Maribrevibacterium harenarium]TPE54432.1 DUF1679 domain-containing protein [Maribrevibacterium harenarium]